LELYFFYGVDTLNELENKAMWDAMNNFNIHKNQQIDENRKSAKRIDDLEKRIDDLEKSMTYLINQKK
jgi:Heat shock factor binding protein 1